MKWEAWVIIAYYVVGGVGVVRQIGKPREPISNGLGAFTLLLALGICLLVVRIGS